MSKPKQKKEYTGKKYKSAFDTPVIIKNAFDISEKVDPMKTKPKQESWEEQIWDIVYELDCGYCESSHDHDKSREDGVKSILSLLQKERQRIRKEVEKMKDHYELGMSREYYDALDQVLELLEDKER